jgi:hypothetical protein
MAGLVAGALSMAAGKCVSISWNPPRSPEKQAKEA